MWAWYFYSAFGASETPPTPTVPNFLEDLSERLGTRTAENNNTTLSLELNGATIIAPNSFEPDAATHRGNYYYNSTVNALYKKIVTRSEPGVVVAHWQKISN